MEVNISREFSFKHSRCKYRGIPIIAANPDTIGTFEMARTLAPFGLSVALYKHYAEKEAVAFFQSLAVKSNAICSTDITKRDYEKSTLSTSTSFREKQLATVALILCVA